MLQQLHQVYKSLRIAQISRAYHVALNLDSQNKHRLIGIRIGYKTRSKDTVDPIVRLQ
jgi:hypothetical protein